MLNFDYMRIDPPAVCQSEDEAWEQFLEESEEILQAYKEDRWAES